MALTLPRWLSLCVLACAFIWFGILFRVAGPATTAPETPVPMNFQYRGTPALAMEGRVAQANGRLRTLELRDSVLREASGARAGTPAVLVAPQLGADIREELQHRIERQWAALRITSAQRTVVAVVVDTARTTNGLPQARPSAPGTAIEIFPPNDDTHGACVAIVRNRSVPARPDLLRRTARFLESPEMVDALLNPCALYASFGTPSPTVWRWLFDARWTPARLAAWNETPSPWRGLTRDPVFDRAPWWLVPDVQDQLRMIVAPSGLACIAGQRGACQRLLFTPPTGEVDSAWRSRVVTSYAAGTSNFYSPIRRSSFGPSDGWIVSDMVRMLGHDKFARFWHSPLPAAEAFRQASGQDVDEWLRAWATHMYGALDVGPNVSGAGLAAGATLIVLALAGAVLIERKRRVM